jgi:CheY-like chemotaxis protein
MENFEELKKHVNILLVDDDLDYISVTSFFLKSKGYNVDIATSGVEAINKVKEGNTHIVLLDYYMPELTGEDVVNKLREFNTEIIIILQTGFAGQQPPEETLTRLNIQNYHDKSDGVEKLILQVMSAVRIFEQQNQVQMSKYRMSAVSKLIRGIAENLKSPILSIGAGMEATKILIDEIKDKVDSKAAERVDKLYQNNKGYLAAIDNALSTVITQIDTEDETESLLAKEVINSFDLILSSEFLKKDVTLEKDITIDEEAYIYGRVSDLIFIVCELLNRVLEVSKKGDNVKLKIDNTNKSWRFTIESENISKVSKKYIYIAKNIICRIDSISLEEKEDKYVIELIKEK